MTIFITEEEPALQKVFVVAIDRAANVAIGVSPRARLDIDPSADQTDRRPPFVDVGECSLGPVVKDRTMS